MKYLSTSDLANLPYKWNELIQEIYSASDVVREGDYQQPIKQYLRYKDVQNRIIAMPAYIGREINVAGIKWIASFPGNVEKAISRAHATIILNHSETGKPFAIWNTPGISAIRTASVTGAFLKRYFELKENVGPGALTFGICGFGPIGQIHLDMLEDSFGFLIKEYLIYDLRSSVENLLPGKLRGKVRFTPTWQEAFNVSDVFCTCTVSSFRYVDLSPKVGSLHLNISLRDYHPHFKDHVNLMVVDSWDEVCRENTDIQRMHLERALTQDETMELPSFLLQPVHLDPDDIVMFNPMGMAIYDLAIAKHLYLKANELGLGIVLPD